MFGPFELWSIYPVKTACCDPFLVNFLLKTACFDPFAATACCYCLLLLPATTACCYCLLLLPIPYRVGGFSERQLLLRGRPHLLAPPLALLLVRAAGCAAPAL